jgi:glycogen debranching enzyme
MGKQEPELFDLAEKLAITTDSQPLDDVSAVLGRLAFEWEGLTLYRAADPGYQRFFYRDSSIGARLMSDHELMRSNVVYAAGLQGQKYDPQTGEEPGKMPHEKHHELPDVIMPNGKSTTYNACDTTAMFLCDIAALAQKGNPELLDIYRPNIEAATSYIKSHVKGGLFMEDPSFAGAENFGLKVTYWKDSVLNDPERVEPVYPVVFTQAHFQNAEALLEIGSIAGDESLIALAEEMYAAGVEKLWAHDHFVTAIDGLGAVDPPSCDSLLSLLHIPPLMLPEGYAEAIERYMMQLETPAGYLSGIKINSSDDDYHTRYVWTHLQGLHHMAATRHGLVRSAEVSNRVRAYIPAKDGIFPELLDPLNNFKPGGQNMLQFWSAAMYRYFETKTPVAEAA